MELNECIKHILDGNAVIIMGAGASYGAKNAFGEFPSGSNLAEYLYSKCDITPDDKNDLQDAAQCFEEQFGAMHLITEIRTLLTCASFTRAHEVVYALPWMRYYTTNYDDVALLAAKNAGKTLVPVTLSSDFRDYHNDENLCVHINGHIGNLSEETLHNEFKLTSNSYMSQTNILESQWGDYFANDLDTAKCIVVIGLSLKNDLDLSRIIFNASYVEKTVIIDSPTLSSNSENRLKRYGTVHKIGVDGFADEIQIIQKTYSPKAKSPTDRLYTAFNYEYHRFYNLEAPTPDVVFRLYLNGEYNDSLFFRNKGKYNSFVYRKQFREIKQAVLNKKRFVFIHADMGNGKTASINELRFSISRENIHIFSLFNADSKKINEEISAICTLSKTERVLIIIDDYTNYMDVLHRFALQSEGYEQYVLAARTALNYNKMPIVLDDFGVREDESSIVNVNRIETGDLDNCVSVFDQYGLFGQRAKLDKSKKVEYLADRNGGARKFQSIMLDVIRSEVIKEKIDVLVRLIKEESSQYHDAIILILLVKVMNLRISSTDIERIIGISLTTDALFKSNPAIKELIAVKETGGITVKAPVTARYVLHKTSAPESIIEALCKLANYSVQYSDTDKFSNTLTAIISYSHISSFLKGFNNPEQFLSEYYDQLSKIGYYRGNNFFWLQYAISCIETRKFERAQQYLDTAYGLIPDGFVPFQINNQQARFYLERIVNNMSLKPQEDLAEAHKLLMIPITSAKDNEINVVKLFGYYCRKKIKAVMSGEKNNDTYKGMCKEAFDRLTKFMEKHPEYSNDLRDLKKKLMQSYCA